MRRPTEKLGSFAAIIVYSMAADAKPSGGTPFGSSVPSKIGTPVPGEKAAPGSSAGPGQLLSTALGILKKQRTYLGGSKALDALAKFIQATEGYFHPSNYGKWAPKLGRFLQNVTWEFLKRWREEERKECRTPTEWRLTPTIKREFVLTMRTVALLSMFSRDPITIANAQAALKTMALLEPDLIVPSVLERAFPALETLTETHRTTACITALATISPAMISRTNYPPGAKHLISLLELCLPGLDVNDPIKTMSTGMFVLQACSQIVIDDLTRPELQDTVAAAGEYGMALESATSPTIPTLSLNGADPTATTNESSAKVDLQEEDEAVRMMTAGFPDWLSSFMRGVLAVFEALPEVSVNGDGANSQCHADLSVSQPGKGSRNGGKMEDQMTQTLVVRCHQSSPGGGNGLTPEQTGCMRHGLRSALAVHVRPRSRHRCERDLEQRPDELCARHLAARLKLCSRRLCQDAPQVLPPLRHEHPCRTGKRSCQYPIDADGQGHRERRDASLVDRRPHWHCHERRRERTSCDSHP